MQAKSTARGGDERIADQADADGIALILQTLPPIVPILGKSDLLNLNQNLSNLNNMNNIQLAVMLAHQVQQLNTTMTQMPAFPKQPADADAHSASDAVDDKAKCVRCNICGKRQKTKSIENAPDTAAEEMQSTKKDAATVTDDIDDIGTNPNHLKHIDIGTETEAEIVANDESFSLTAAESSASINSQSNDASTQTDDKSIYECCFQCRHHHQCHHHHILLNKLSTKERAEEMKINNKSPTEAKPIELKELKDIQRLEDRPKWGVNRPHVQYVKASERDPNYVRNRKKNHKKRLPRMNPEGVRDLSTSDGRDVFSGVSRSNSPTPSTITNGTVTLSTSPKRESQLKLKKVRATPSSSSSSSSKRNICTEILPIKTDMNGRVYLNFREASVVMSEDEIRQNLKNRYNKMERIINRGRTIDDTFATHSGGGGSSGGNDSETSRKSQRNRSDVEIDSVWNGTAQLRWHWTPNRLLLQEVIDPSISHSLRIHSNEYQK